MKNPNLDKIIDSLFDCTNRGANPKTVGLYDKPIVITFDGLSCEIPFNALNYITLTNALCKIANTFEEYPPQINEAIFDLMAAEQLRFNLEQCLACSDPPEIYERNFKEYDQAREKRNEVERNLKALLNVDHHQFWKLKEKTLEII